MELLSLSNLTKTYDTHDVRALNGVDLTVSEGEMVALMGPSGCGKSTLLNIVGGIDRPTNGHVVLDGTNMASLNDQALTELRRRRIGFIFQFFNLLSTLTVAENVALPLELEGLPPGAIQQRVTESLAQVGMADRATFYPSQLSGGQMQRVAIARAIIHQPALLLADEPTGNLDSENGEKVMQLLQHLCKIQRQTLLIATHSDEAARYAHRRVHMSDGKIVRIDSAAPA